MNHHKDIRHEAAHEKGDNRTSGKKKGNTTLTRGDHLHSPHKLTVNCHSSRECRRSVLPDGVREHEIPSYQDIKGSIRKVARVIELWRALSAVIIRRPSCKEHYISPAIRAHRIRSKGKARDSRLSIPCVRQLFV